MDKRRGLTAVLALHGYPGLPGSLPQPSLPLCWDPAPQPRGLKAAAETDSSLVSSWGANLREALAPGHPTVEEWAHQLLPQ